MKVKVYLKYERGCTCLYLAIDVMSIQPLSYVCLCVGNIKLVVVYIVDNVVVPYQMAIFHGHVIMVSFLKKWSFKKPLGCSLGVNECGPKGVTMHPINGHVGFSSFFFLFPFSNAQKEQFRILCVPLKSTITKPLLPLSSQNMQDPNNYNVGLKTCLWGTSNSKVTMTILP